MEQEDRNYANGIVEQEVRNDVNSIVEQVGNYTTRKTSQTCLNKNPTSGLGGDAITRKSLWMDGWTPDDPLWDKLYMLVELLILYNAQYIVIFNGCMMTAGIIRMPESTEIMTDSTIKLFHL